ncbi:hypothetical protein [Legionella sp.]|uniref:hypothetical protein n=1 Tax=Legionella sp. TaxID=459 RepID=UPI003D0D3960
MKFIRSELFFQGKKSLEELYILLNDERIPLDSKKMKQKNSLSHLMIVNDLISVLLQIVDWVHEPNLYLTAVDSS